jgi:hypothetical protein
MDIKEIEWEDVDWIDLAQDRKLQWILGFCNMLGIWLAEDLLVSLEGLCCMELSWNCIRLGNGEGE